MYFVADRLDSVGSDQAWIVKTIHGRKLFSDIISHRHSSH